MGKKAVSCVTQLVFRYWKPPGVLSTTLPSKDGRNIIQHSPRIAKFLANIAHNEPVVPIGRLDKASTGLLLLTTDPSLCAQLLRPGLRGSPIIKEYQVTTTRRMPDEALQKMRNGIEIKVYRKMVKTLPCKVQRIPSDDEARGDRSSRGLLFSLKEGKNRQIRKMVGAFNHAVEHLCRVRFGNITLDGLSEGQIEVIDEEALQDLLNAKDRITFVNRMSGDYVYMMNARADCDVEMQQNVACMATLLLYLMNAIYY